MDPIFIVGCGRSGTTLLRLILNRHSKIAIPEETWYYPALSKELPELMKGEWKKKVATRILELNRVHFPELTAVALEKYFDGLSSDDAEKIIPAVNIEFMIREGKVRWGDKTPGYVMRLPFLKSLFPQSRIIHIVRDGRDVVPSVLKYWSVGPQTTSFLETVFYWKKQVMAGIQDGPLYFGDRYREVRYEDLVRFPEQTVRTICDFIGEDFEANMLVQDKKDSSYTQEWAWHEESKKSINTDNVEKWRVSLTPYQVCMIELAGSNILKRFGYQKSGQFSLRAGFGFYAFAIRNWLLEKKNTLKRFVYFKLKAWRIKKQV